MTDVCREPAHPRCANRSPAILCGLFLLLIAGPLAAVQISEIRIDQPSTDFDEYFELAGAAGEPLDGLTYLVIGDGAGGSGVVEAVVDLAGQTIPASGFFVAAEDTFTLGTADLVLPSATNGLNFENSDNVTHLLVTDFSGASGDDLDLDDDGVLDVEPWSSVEDCVGLVETPGSGDLIYCATTVGPDGPFVPGHAYLCPEGWQIGAFDPAGGNDTPGAANECPEPTASLSEIRIDQPSTDNDEYFELEGPPEGSLDGLTYLVIGDGTGGSGVVEAVVDLAGQTIPASGFFVAAEDTFTLGTADLVLPSATNGLNFENSDNVTHLLVRDFSGANGQDLDADDDGVLDVEPWTEVLDCVGLVETPGSGDLIYCATTVGPDGPFVPGHAYLCPEGWQIGAFDPAGGDDTPGAPNGCAVPPVPTLVINEIDYDQPGTDFGEFIEIKNVGSASVDLGAFDLVLVNGTGGGAAIYNTIPLPSVSLTAGGYFVVCGDPDRVSPCDLDASPDSNLIQNGSPDAVALVLGTEIVDTVSYEGDTGAPYTEGSGAGLEDDSSGGTGGPNENKGISRFPDGIDTDQNNVDLSLRCATPGATNVAETADCPSVAPLRLVINEIDYDQPGIDTAEFVEIKNVGGGGASLAGVELVLVNGTGGGAAIYNSIALPAVTLGGGDHFVVCANAATVANCDLDADPDTNFIQNGAPDAVALMRGGLILDTVSYEGDTGAPYTEGSGSGLEDSGSTGEDNKGISRLPDGADSGVNNVDLANVCITPGGPNTSLDSGCSPVGPVREIFEIQGSGLVSPLVGEILISTDNVVTEVAPLGFFMQTPAARSDGDPYTSDGIFVFINSAPPVVVGDAVTVAGEVHEYFELTEIFNVSALTVLSSGNPLPDPVLFDETTPSPFPMDVPDMERFEGMLASFEGIASGPTNRFGEVPVVAGEERAFREPGILYPGLPGLPVFDGNPQVFEVDTDTLDGIADQVFTGQEIAASGPVTFAFGDYQILPSTLTLGPEPPVLRPVRERAFGELTVASQNAFRLFDDQDDPTINEPVLTPQEFADLLAKFSLHVREVLGAPDILAFQEIENLNVLESLAAWIEFDDPSLVYSAYLLEGNDVGGIDVGYLTRDDTIQVGAVTQFGKDQLFYFDDPPSLLNDRPPLVLEADYVGGGGSFPLTVINVHQRSLGGIDDPDDGTRVKTKRLEQAESLAMFVQDIQSAEPERRVVVTGDFNAFQFTDGYVDVMGILTGTPDPLGAEFPGSVVVDPPLANRVLELPAEERYSLVFEGDAEVLDHALTTGNLASSYRSFEYARGNSDSPGALRGDPTTPLAASDHDGLVLYLIADSDGDGVPDDVDVCAGTVIPESVPTRELGVNRWALVDGDGIFDTQLPSGEGPGESFTIEETAGCSCEQIIEALGLGEGHRKFGCSVGAMRNWVDLVNP